MWIILFAMFVPFSQAFSILDLKKLKVKLEPEKCSESHELVALIHSAPKNVDLRNTIRRTWGKDIKRIFVLGKHKEWNKKLKKEHEKHQDILQVSFQDAYRNMTYKHLSGYWWMINNCNSTKYILRSDDDQAVDVHHLPLYLNQYINHDDNFYLCHVFEKTKPKRSPGNKWFVSFQDYPHEYYPDYCCGWAYVTSIKTMKSILEVSKDEPYFWIDDMFVTGTLVNKLQKEVKIYDWSNSFLVMHVQHQSDILSGNFFSPELMVASDISSAEISHLSKKFQQCHNKDCYKMIYGNPELVEYMRPSLKLRGRIKSEL